MPEGAEIVKAYMGRQEAYIQREERLVIVRILVSHLTMVTGKENFYPSSDMKEALAKAIVTTFSCLGIPSTDGTTSYAHYYNRKTTNGFIDTRLKTLREPEKNKRNCSPRPRKSTETPTKKSRRELQTNSTEEDRFDKIECAHKVGFS